MVYLKDGKESEIANPFSRVPSQRFKEAFPTKSLAYIFLYWSRGVYRYKPVFLEGFNSKSQKDASFVYDEIIQDLRTNSGNREKWSKWLERPRNKWGDSPLEKALANVFIPFLAVTSKLVVC